MLGLAEAEAASGEATCTATGDGETAIGDAAARPGRPLITVGKDLTD